MRDSHQTAIEIVGPAVISTRDPTVFYAADRQLDLAVRAVVFDRSQPTVTRPEERECHMP
jgi:hypothetical protein